MGNDMPVETRNNVQELLSDPLGPGREAFRQVFEQQNREYWSTAWGSGTDLTYGPE